MKSLFKQVTAIATAIFLAGCGSSANTGPVIEQPTPPVNQAKKVIVVGAGMSGMKAANKLASAGFVVQVLEGRDRIGGRTWSNSELGVPLDMGASWIHESSGNPIHELAQQLNVPLHTWDYDNHNTYGLNGEMDSAIEAKLASFEDDLMDWSFSAVIADENATIGDAVNKAKAEGKLDGFSEVEINFGVNSSVEQSSGAEVDDMSIMGLENLDGFSGPDKIFPQGYDALAKALAEGVDVKLNTWVSGIDYSNEKVTVSTSQGDFEADYVIVTVPLGVLKKNKITFTPALPQNKLAAINALDMGVLNKVYLKFDSVFWDNNVTNMSKVSQQKGRFAYWINLEPALNQPILTAFNVADFGKAIEQQSDEQIIEQAMATLKQMYGEQIPQPNAHLITRWAADEFSYGSYSYVPRGATADMREDLAEPVSGKVFFAGEATSTKYPSTVHGAFLSGEREADRIIGL